MIKWNELELQLYFETDDLETREICQLYWDRKSNGEWAHHVPEIAKLQDTKAHKISKTVKDSCYVKIQNFTCAECLTDFGKFRSRTSIRDWKSYRNRYCDDCRREKSDRFLSYSIDIDLETEESSEAYHNPYNPRKCDYCPSQLEGRYGTGSALDLFCPTCNHEPGNKSCNCKGCVIRNRLQMVHSKGFLNICANRYRHDGRKQTFTKKQEEEIRYFEWRLGQNTTIYAIEQTRDKFTFEEPIGGEDGKFSYFCAICNNKYKAIQERLNEQRDLEKETVSNDAWKRRTELQSLRLAEEEKQRTEEKDKFAQYLSSLTEDEREELDSAALKRAPKLMRTRYLANKDLNPKIADVYYNLMLESYLRGLIKE